MNIIIYTVIILVFFYILLRLISNISSKKLSKGLRLGSFDQIRGMIDEELEALSLQCGGVFSEELRYDCLIGIDDNIAVEHSEPQRYGDNLNRYKPWRNKAHDEVGQAECEMH